MPLTKPRSREENIAKAMLLGLKWAGGDGLNGYFYKDNGDETVTVHDDDLDDQHPFIISKGPENYD